MKFEFNCPVVSEDKMFENVDGRRHRRHWYTHSSPRSLHSGEPKTVEKIVVVFIYIGH